MASKGELRFRVGNNTVDLDVLLPDEKWLKPELFRGADNVAALRRVRNKRRGIFTPERRNRLLMSYYHSASREPVDSRPKESRYAGRSFGNLWSLAVEGDKRPQLANVGSSVRVNVIKVLRDGREKPVYTALPREPAVIPHVRSMAASVKQALSGKLQVKGDEVDWEVDQVVQAALLRQLGFPNTKAGEEVGVSDSQVKEWMSRKHMPRFLANLNPKRRALLSSQRSQSPPLRIPKGESENFAYFLGACAAVRMSGPYSAQFNFSNKPPEVMEALYSKLEESTGKKARPYPVMRKEPPKGRKNRESYVLSFPLPGLAEHINAVTDNNTRLPLEHLGTKEERIAYLMGWADFSKSLEEPKYPMEGRQVIRPMIGLGRTYSDTMLKELALVMLDVGLVPKVDLGKHKGLRLYEHGQVKKFVKVVGFRSTERMARTQKLIASAEADIPEATRARFDYSPEKYYQVKRYVEKHQDETPSQIARAKKIDVSVVDGWFKKNADGRYVARSRPPSVKRKEEIEGFRKEVGDIEVPAYLYRLGVSSDVARSMARSVDLKGAKRLCASLEEKGRHGVELARAVEEEALKLKRKTPKGSKVGRPGLKVDPDALARHIEELKQQLEYTTKDQRGSLDSQIRLLEDRLTGLRISEAVGSGRNVGRKCHTLRNGKSLLAVRQRFYDWREGIVVEKAHTSDGHEESEHAAERDFERISSGIRGRERE